MRELYIDFDGVIMDTIPYLYRDLEASNVDSSSEEEMVKFFSKYDYSTIINDSNILNDSLQCIKKLKESRLFQISILTHICSLEEGIVKVNYIRRYFKDITIVLTPTSIEKTEMVHSENAILVDDYSGNLRAWKEKGGIAVRFSKNLEKSDFITINKLDELIKFVDIYNEK